MSMRRISEFLTPLDDETRKGTLTLEGAEAVLRLDDAEEEGFLAERYYLVVTSLPNETGSQQTSPSSCTSAAEVSSVAWDQEEPISLEVHRDELQIRLEVKHAGFFEDDSIDSVVLELDEMEKNASGERCLEMQKGGKLTFKKLRWEFGPQSDQPEEPEPDFFRRISEAFTPDEPVNQEAAEDDGYFDDAVRRISTSLGFGDDKDEKNTEGIQSIPEEVEDANMQAETARKDVEAKKEKEEAELRNTRKAEELAKKEADEQAKKEAEEEAEEQARKATEEVARKEAEELARKEAEEKKAWTKVAEEKAVKEAEEEARKVREETAETARKEVEEERAKATAKKETEELAKKEVAEAAATKKAEEEAAATKKTAEEAAATLKAEEEASATLKARVEAHLLSMHPLPEEEAAVTLKAEEEASATKKAEEEAASATKDAEAKAKKEQGQPAEKGELGKKCNACGEQRLRAEYSGKQWQAKSVRRCKDCIAGGAAVP
jgi:hypothetical protein